MPEAVGILSLRLVSVMERYLCQCRLLSLHVFRSDIVADVEHYRIFSLVYE